MTVWASLVRAAVLESCPSDPDQPASRIIAARPGIAEGTEHLPIVRRTTSSWTVEVVPGPRMQRLRLILHGGMHPSTSGLLRIRSVFRLLVSVAIRNVSSTL